jgi:hypothetical protein
LFCLGKWNIVGPPGPLNQGVSIALAVTWLSKSPRRSAVLFGPSWTPAERRRRPVPGGPTLTPSLPDPPNERTVRVGQPLRPRGSPGDAARPLPRVHGATSRSVLPLPLAYCLTRQTDAGHNVAQVVG